MPGLGDRTILRLVEIFGSPEKVLAASPKELSLRGPSRDMALGALGAKKFAKDPQAEFLYLKKNGFRMVCRNDADYPANLSQIPDPPAVLFVSGELLPRDLAAIAVVGSRYASPAGVLFAERLSSDLTSCGLTVVSGFAMGIDSAAHRGALKAGGRTLAVLGCGLDINYPSINSDLRRRIGRNGGLLTEFVSGTPPSAGNFPARNRIISGLSLGVVVVEAAERSGSLITARLALEQGREVFAVPGMAQSMRSKGTHKLIKQGAKLVENAEDVLEEIRPLLRTGQSLPGAVPLCATGAIAHKQEEARGPEEKTLLKILDKIPKQIDQIALEAGMPVQRALAILLELELMGLVAQLPGKYFICGD
ncbi:MAG: DNA-processing protein DprA [Syntrophobacteraceae bacterium]